MITAKKAATGLSNGLDTSNSNLLIGGIVGGIVGVLVIVLVMSCFFYQRWCFSRRDTEKTIQLHEIYNESNDFYLQFHDFRNSKSFKNSAIYDINSENFH